VAAMTSLNDAQSVSAVADEMLSADMW